MHAHTGKLVRKVWVSLKYFHHYICNATVLVVWQLISMEIRITRREGGIKNLKKEKRKKPWKPNRPFRSANDLTLACWHGRQRERIYICERETILSLSDHTFSSPNQKQLLKFHMQTIASYHTLIFPLVTYSNLGQRRAPPPILKHVVVCVSKKKECQHVRMFKHSMTLIQIKDKNSSVSVEIHK